MDPYGAAACNHSHVQEYSEHLMKKDKEKWKLGDEKLVVEMICHDNRMQR